MSSVGSIPASREKMEMMSYIINSGTGKFRLGWRLKGDPAGKFRQGPAAYLDKITAEVDAERILALYDAVTEVRVETI